MHFGEERKIRADLRVKMLGELGGEIVRRGVIAGSGVKFGVRRTGRWLDQMK